MPLTATAWAGLLLLRPRLLKLFVSGVMCVCGGLFVSGCHALCGGLFVSGCHARVRWLDCRIGHIGENLLSTFVSVCACGVCVCTQSVCTQSAPCYSPQHTLLPYLPSTQPARPTLPYLPSPSQHTHPAPPSGAMAAGDAATALTAGSKLVAGAVGKAALAGATVSCITYLYDGSCKGGRGVGAHVRGGVWRGLM